MKIVLTGGGSGGHITPLMALAAELKKWAANVEVIYVGQTGDSLGDVPANDPNIDTSYSVRAGKFRRYHGEGLRQLLDVKTLALNIRDSVYVVIGFWQSRRLLKRLKPDAIFIKGGFVGVPVGLAAATLHQPFITHDSDAVPGLANRIIARWATLHAVALPKEVYSYPPEQTVTTGIPVQEQFHAVSAKHKQQYRTEIRVPNDAQVLMVTGGGLGSQRINDAVLQIAPHLLEEFPKLHILHVVGRSHETEVDAQYTEKLSAKLRRRVQVHGFISDLYRYSGASDLIVTRAGATVLADFAMQGRACIVIPSPFLTGGHQLKNADYLVEQGAASVLHEVEVVEDPNKLAREVSRLFHNTNALHQLEQAMSGLAKPHATAELATLLVKCARTSNRG